MVNKFDINRNKLEIGDIVILYGCIEARTGEFEFWEVYADNKFTSHSVFIRGLTSRKSDSFHCDCLKKVDKKYKELVEKATPKKPSFDKSWEDEETTDIYNEYGSINENVCECPNCHKHSIYDSEYGVRFNHCHECGQALDWSDEE